MKTMVQPFDYKQAVKNFRRQAEAQIAGFITFHSEMRYAEIAGLFGCDARTIANIARAHSIKRKLGRPGIARNAEQPNG